ncbi:hypothetical protein GCM10007913_13270 [Devosia yakushimensis]|uniref:Uncharacterized protein n=1 Tax=Devosia yakushimensis TaxID=470028 RepID=A0ABQ5UCE2_9HYPH|nr:hypothetical protein GCM10007913_13270 [Devosia yakushimensis]
MVTCGVELGSDMESIPIAEETGPLSRKRERWSSVLRLNATLRDSSLLAFPNTLLTKNRQSPQFPLSLLDKNKQGTYKNIIATREMQMLTFLKDFAAFVTLGAFTIGSLTWMDVLTRLV